MILRSKYDDERLLEVIDSLLEEIEPNPKTVIGRRANAMVNMKKRQLRPLPAVMLDCLELYLKNFGYTKENIEKVANIAYSYWKSEESATTSEKHAKATLELMSLGEYMSEADRKRQEKVRKAIIKDVDKRVIELRLDAKSISERPENRGKRKSNKDGIV